MEDVSVPYMDPNDLLNDTEQSGDHYSNGDSRLTPEYEWNGWEKVYRTKKPARCTYHGHAPEEVTSRLAEAPGNGTKDHSHLS